MITTLPRPEEESAGRTSPQASGPVCQIGPFADFTTPALPVWVDRHCPECGLLEPHHRKNCPYGLEE